MLTSSSRASARTDADADRPQGSLTIFMESAGWWQRTGAISLGGSLLRRASPGAKPRYDTALKVLHSLGVKLSVSPT